MIALLALLLGLGVTAPREVIVTGPGGETRVPVRAGPTGAPMLPAPQLLVALGGRGGFAVHVGFLSKG